MTARRRGLTIRLRLTLLIGAVLILAGSILLGLTYLLVRHSVDTNPAQVRAEVARRLGVEPIMTDAAQRRLAWSAGLGGRPGEPVPATSDYLEVLTWYDRWDRP